MPTGLHEALRTLAEELHDAAQANTQDLLRCDRGGAEGLMRIALVLQHGRPTEGTEDLRIFLSDLLKRGHKEMAATEGLHSWGWRRMYTDACMLLAYADVLDFSATGDNALALSAVSHLDHSIVIAGAPGEGRWNAILDIIDGIQAECLDFSSSQRKDVSFVAAAHPSSESNFVAAPLLSAEKPVLRLDTPPSLGTFVSRLSRQPFVLPGFLLDWPALNEHPWRSLDYLRAVAGPGRVVPVEVGSDYRSDDWTQKMMPWDEFLANLEEDEGDRPAGTPPRPVLYLAQHSLFSQFPALTEDILVPDYVYCDLGPPEDYPRYVPPANDERLVLNAWLGPAGTVSPAHTDPFFNFYGQVVGRKTIWLAPPGVSPYMYSYPIGADIAGEVSNSSQQPRNPAANNESPSLSNTSRVDVLVSSPEDHSRSKSEYPVFWEKAVPDALSVTLKPGDLLFFPPGWWHAMRSEETSFSVSMWF
ncbi:Clavaminate synthase-like protein [Dichomitus squalens]|uniref:Clavaminate synthase-like protein n=1 Tax=Dichomitus squalens TaxID=114155 RepID=A0A4Q9Q0Y1_9APHY|nr:Clavaminate synthase-like protein [Dichomitus squalens]